MYSRNRMITDLTKVKFDIRDILVAAEGVATPHTMKTLKKAVLSLDDVLADEHQKSKELRKNVNQ